MAGVLPLDTPRIWHVPDRYYRMLSAVCRDDQLVKQVLDGAARRKGFDGWHRDDSDEP